MKRISYALFILALFFVPLVVVQATSHFTDGGSANNPTYRDGGTAPVGQQGDPNLINPLGEGASLEGLLLGIIDLFITIGTLVIITMIIYIGFLFIAAQGAPEKISNARNMLLWTLIGGLILLGAKGISLTICNTVSAVTGAAQCQQP